jgi:hypothetical protein
VKERNGLYMQLEFVCYNCGFSTRLSSSPQMPNSRRHEVNVRLVIGDTLCGLGRGGIIKLLGALNLPPPVQEEKYREIQEFVLNYGETAQEKSMAGAVKEAIAEAGGAREFTVSGDGAWLTRGHTSIHGIAALCSVTVHPKVVDTNWCSKKCSRCQGAESLRHMGADLFSTFQENHDCQLNYTGKPFLIINYFIIKVFLIQEHLVEWKKK